MYEVLGSGYFKDFIVPLVSVFLTIAIKVVSRRDLFISPTRDDFAIGFDLLTTSLILLVMYSSKLAIDLQSKGSLNAEFCQKKLQILPWIITLAILFVWGLSSVVRIWGWQNNQNRILKLWPGVIIPLMIGVAALLLTVNFIE